MSDIQKPKIQPGIYRNRKNQKLYFFTGEVGKDSETLEWKTAYHALYDDGEIWYRPTSIFFEEKEPGNPKSTRFELICNLSSRAKNMILPGSRVYEQGDGSFRPIYNVVSVAETHTGICVAISSPCEKIKVLTAGKYFMNYKSAE